MLICKCLLSLDNLAVRFRDECSVCIPLGPRRGGQSLICMYVHPLPHPRRPGTSQHQTKVTNRSRMMFRYVSFLLAALAEKPLAGRLKYGALRQIKIAPGYILMWKSKSTVFNTTQNPALSTYRLVLLFYLYVTTKIQTFSFAE